MLDIKQLDLAKVAANKLFIELDIKEGQRQGLTSFLDVMNFLSENTAKGSSVKAEFGSSEYFLKAARRYFKGRYRAELPTAPKTVPDEMVSYIMHVAFKYPVGDLPKLSVAHQKAMAAENAVGDLLERYIASVLESCGWTWCSGTLVTATDFIKFDSQKKLWTVLQIKNRDNSENSSSSGFRNTLKVESWFRTFSATGLTNWNNFPQITNGEQKLLSEEGFKTFVRNFYDELKKN